MFDNILAHPKTTLFGALTGLTTMATILAQTGFHIGHFGTTDFVTLTAGIGTMLLGALAKDPNSTK